MKPEELTNLETAAKKAGFEAVTVKALPGGKQIQLTFAIPQTSSKDVDPLATVKEIVDGLPVDAMRQVPIYPRDLILVLLNDDALPATNVQPKKKPTRAKPSDH